MTGQFSPGTLVSHYRLDALIGAGGMGEVYRATDTPTGNVVAVKIFGRAAVEARELARFYHEARIHG
jgi:serine/threonine protein kinase